MCMITYLWFNEVFLWLIWWITMLHVVCHINCLIQIQELKRNLKGVDFWHDPDAEGIYIKTNRCSPEWRWPEQRARLIALTACHLISDMREDLEILCFYHCQTQIYKTLNIGMNDCLHVPVGCEQIDLA